MNKEKASKAVKARKALRIITWLAVICTVILTGILLIEGLTPGDASSAQSNVVTAVINKILKRETTIAVKRISFADEHVDTKYYQGDTVELGVIYYPDDATKKGVTYKVDDTSVAKVENGILTFLEEGSVTVTAVTTDGSYITTQRTYDCYGEKHEYDYNKLAITFDSEPVIGTSVGVHITYDGEEVPSYRVELPLSEGVIWANRFKAYKTDVNFKINLDYDVFFIKTVSVAHADLSVPESLTLNRKTAVIAVGDSISFSYTVFPSDAKYDAYVVIEDESVLAYQGTAIRAVGIGTTTVTYRSAYTDIAYDTMEVTVCEQVSPSLGTPSTLVMELNPTVAVGDILYPSVIVDKYRILAPDSYSVTVDGDSAFYSIDKIIGVKPGEATLSTTINGITASATVSVYGTVPTYSEIRAQSSLSVVAGKIKYLQPSYAQKSGARINAEFVFTSSDPSVATVSEGGIVEGIAKGNCIITVSSVYNRAVKKEIALNVLSAVPTEITLVGDERLAYNTSARYSVQYERYFANDQVIWEVVSGPAEVDKNGILTCTGLGDIILRAHSSLNPELVAEKTVHGVIYKSFSLFIRKFIGHFSAFAVLGLGAYACCIFLFKHKVHTAWAAPLYVFAIAGLSEIFQLPIFTSGRYATFLDVIIDFAGGLIGMAAGFIITLLILGISRLSGGEFYNEFKAFSARKLRKRNKNQTSR